MEIHTSRSNGWSGEEPVRIVEIAGIELPVAIGLGSSHVENLE